MGRANCPNCGRICGKVVAQVRGFAGEESIHKVYGTCKKHGEVDLSAGDWWWEDFFGWE